MSLDRLCPKVEFAELQNVKLPKIVLWIVHHFHVLILVESIVFEQGLFLLHKNVRV